MVESTGVYTAGGPVSVTNTAAITSGGKAIRTKTYGGAATTITNSGALTSATGDGIHATALVGSGNSYDYKYNSFGEQTSYSNAYNAGGAITISNSAAGAIDAGNIGIAAYDQGGAITITNAATIAGATGPTGTEGYEGIRAVEAGYYSSYTGTNTYSATGVYTGGTAIGTYTAGGAITITNSGAIDPSGTAIRTISIGGAPTTITNSGALTSTNANGIHATALTGPGSFNNTFNSFGFLTSFDNTNNASSAIGITNTGAITADKIGIKAYDQGAVTISNTAEIIANYEGIRAVEAGYYSSQTGTNTYSATGVYTGGTAIGTYVAGGAITVTNSGAIDPNGTAIRTKSIGGATTTITNSGVLMSNNADGIHATALVGPGSYNNTFNSFGETLSYNNTNIAAGDITIANNAGGTIYAGNDGIVAYDQARHHDHQRRGDLGGE